MQLRVGLFCQPWLHTGVALLVARFGQGLSFEDLIGEGNAELIKAADKFDPEMDYRFSTYATVWTVALRQRCARWANR